MRKLRIAAVATILAGFVGLTATGLVYNSKPGTAGLVTIPPPVVEADSANVLDLPPTVVETASATPTVTAASSAPSVLPSSFETVPASSSEPAQASASKEVQSQTARVLAPKQLVVPEKKVVQSPQKVTKYPTGRPIQVSVFHPGERKAYMSARLVPTELKKIDKELVLKPPFGVAGWYKEGTWPKPGYPGPAVIAGHVNSKSRGEDVFSNLPSTRKGDLIVVLYDTGDRVTFRVTEIQRSLKWELPVDKIWSQSMQPGLRLVSCDKESGLVRGSFRGNLTAYADELVTVK